MKANRQTKGYSNASRKRTADGISGSESNITDPPSPDRVIHLDTHYELPMKRFHRTTWDVSPHRYRRNSVPEDLEHTPPTISLSPAPIDTHGETPIAGLKAPANAPEPGQVPSSGSLEVKAFSHVRQQEHQEMTIPGPPRAHVDQTEMGFLFDNMANELRALLPLDITSESWEEKSYQTPLQQIMEVVDMPVIERNQRFLYLVGTLMLRATYQQEHVIESFCERLWDPHAEECDHPTNELSPKHILPDAVTDDMVDNLYATILSRMEPRNKSLSELFQMPTAHGFRQQRSLKVPATVEDLKDLATQFFDWFSKRLPSEKLKEISLDQDGSLNQGGGHAKSGNELELDDAEMPQSNYNE